MTAERKSPDRWLAPSGTGLQNVGLALMAGGMLALGAFTAPAVFGGFPRESAAPVMTLIFSRFDLLLIISLGLLWLGEALKRLGRAVIPSGLNRFRIILMILLSVALVYSTQALTPEITKLNRSGAHRDFSTPMGRHFNDIHRRAERLYRIEWLMSVLLILLSPFTLRSAVIRRNETSAVAAPDSAHL